MKYSTEGDSPVGSFLTVSQISLQVSSLLVEFEKEADHIQRITLICGCQKVYSFLVLHSKNHAVSYLYIWNFR